MSCRTRPSRTSPSRSRVRTRDRRRRALQTHCSGVGTEVVFRGLVLPLTFGYLSGMERDHFFITSDFIGDLARCVGQGKSIFACCVVHCPVSENDALTLRRYSFAFHYLLALHYPLALHNPPAYRHLAAKLSSNGRHSLCYRLARLSSVAHARRSLDEGCSWS